MKQNESKQKIFQAYLALVKEPEYPDQRAENYPTIWDRPKHILFPL